MKKILLAFFLVAIFISRFSSSELDFEQSMSSMKSHIENFNELKYKEKLYKQKFNETIEFIKLHEGFRNSTYYCEGGEKTIGYGFVTKYLDKSLRDTITIEQADSVVISKLKYFVKRSKKQYSHLNEFQHLAVAHLFYSKGEGSVINHSINDQLKYGYIRLDTILYFGKYEKSEKSYSKHYKRSRKYEYDLFYLQNKS